MDFAIICFYYREGRTLGFHILGTGLQHRVPLTDTLGGHSISCRAFASGWLGGDHGSGYIFLYLFGKLKLVWEVFSYVGDSLGWRLAKDATALWGELLGYPGA